MQINDVIRGFRIVRVRSLEELHAVLREMPDWLAAGRELSDACGDEIRDTVAV